MRYELNIQPETFELSPEVGEFEASGAAAARLQAQYRRGATYVRWLQQSLNRILGVRLAVDGIIGPRTRSAVRSFQHRRSLAVDGIAGPATEAALIVAGASAPPRPGTDVSGKCNEPIQVVSSFKNYVALVQRAELALIKCGRRSLEDRLHALSGIYYGADWSRDFDVEKSTARNLGFQAFLARPYTASDDPRPCLGCGLFLSLKRSQDVSGVDMGHVMIGLNARMRVASRSVIFPATNSTGLELTTWVGDLAGGSARLALDRASAPATPATRYFSGTDYGAPSNLEGDLAGLLVDAPGVVPRAVSAPAIPPGDLIAPALESFFVTGVGRKDRCRNFLLLHGASFAGPTLTNRSAVRSLMTGKFEAFGRLYMANFLRQRVGNLLKVSSKMAAALPHLPKAAADVADVLIDKLLTCRF